MRIDTGLRLIGGLALLAFAANASAGSQFRQANAAPIEISAPSPYKLTLKEPESYRLKSETADAPAESQGTLIHHFNFAKDKSLPYTQAVSAAARAQNLDPALLHAIIHVESRHNAAAVSPKGAIGLMQVLPETARRMGVSSLNTPEANITAGARYLRFLLDTFGKDTHLALAAYNAGENAVIRHGNRIPPYPETIAYVPAVIDAYAELRRLMRSGTMRP